MLLSGYTLSTLYSFPEGVQANDVVVDGSGNLYGVSYNGGDVTQQNDDQGYGTIWELAKGASTLTTLYTFMGGSDSAAPNSIAIDSHDNLYGTTDGNIYVSDNYGTIWELPKGSGTVITLYNFGDDEEQYISGVGPGAIEIDGNGNLFGTSDSVGVGGDGTIWELAKNSATPVILHSFDGTDGAYPGSITFDPHGNILGTTSYDDLGGPNGDGSIWELSDGNTTFTTLYSGSADGIAVDSAENIYFTTSAGGDNGVDDSALWQLPHGSKNVNLLYSSPNNETEIAGSITADGQGAFYGTGTTNGTDEIYELSPTAEAATNLDFTGQPTETVAGTAIFPPITVAVEDASGDISTTDDSTVTLSVGPGTTGALGGTLTATAVNGVATFSNVILENGGSYTLQATDGSLTPAVSNSITAIVGSVDVANWGQISGWAFDPSTPSSPIDVEVVISGGPGTPQIFAANETRSDLQSVLGSTDHGFDYSPPFLSVGNHAVSVWAIEDNGQGVLIGTATVTSQNSMFDDGYYIREYPNVAAAVNAGQFASGYDHFVQYGQYEGYIPSPYWDYWANQWYEKENPDVAEWATANHLTSAFMQYYDYGQYENRPGLLYFNTSYYDAKYPWVASAVTSGAVTSAFEQFVLYGQYEGYSPMKYFSSAFCDNTNGYIMPSVTGEPFTSDFDWFVEYGQFEGAQVSSYYNEQTYLADNPDVAAAVKAGLFPDGFVHWLEYGQYEGRKAV